MSLLLKSFCFCRKFSAHNPTDQAAGRVPVVACGTFGGTMEQQAAFINRMALECDAGTSARTAIARPQKPLPLRNSTNFQLLSLPANWQLVTRGLPPPLPSPAFVQTLFPYEPTTENAFFSDDVWLSNAETLLRLTRCPLGLYECGLQCFAACDDDDDCTYYPTMTSLTAAPQVRCLTSVS